jgi:hypothetical protein
MRMFGGFPGFRTRIRTLASSYDVSLSRARGGTVIQESSWVDGVDNDTRLTTELAADRSTDDTARSVPSWDERGRAIGSLAADLGLDHLYGYSTSQDLCGVWSLPFRWMGWGTRVANIVFGRVDGIEIVAFDYARFFPFGAYGATANVEASCAFACVSTELPRLTIVPRAWEHPLKRVLPLGGAGLDDPEFERSYRIESKSRASARRVLGPALRSWLADRASAPLAFQSDGHYVASSSHLLEPDEIHPRLLMPLRSLVGWISAVRPVGHARGAIAGSWIRGAL